MKTQLVTALALGALSILSSHAADGRTGVRCERVPFDDIRSIEIQEQTGRYVLIETKSDGKTIVSSAFGEKEVNTSEFPELSSWNGYSRRLVRSAPGEWSIVATDECSSSVTSISCSDSL